jgi:hypothetical protein
VRHHRNSVMPCSQGPAAQKTRNLPGMGAAPVTKQRTPAETARRSTSLSASTCWRAGRAEWACRPARVRRPPGPRPRPSETPSACRAVPSAPRPGCGRRPSRRSAGWWGGSFPSTAGTLVAYRWPCRS